MATLTDLPKYIYGTTRLGDGKIPAEERVKVALAAMKATSWFHTSHTYGDALQIQRQAFDQLPERVPNLIVKIGWDSVEQVRETILENLEPLGLRKLSIGQLCLGGSLGEEFKNQGACYEGLLHFKEEGLVERYVLEVWPWTSDVLLTALRGGYAGRLIDGAIFYLNPLQRFASNELWDALMETGTSIVAMRTTCGGSIERLAAGNGPDYLQKRARELMPVYQQAGCTWPEFCARYVFGVSSVRTTVGATSRAANLEELARATSVRASLPEDLHQQVLDLQRKWSDEHDRFAEPWSM